MIPENPAHVCIVCFILLLAVGKLIGAFDHT